MIYKCFSIFKNIQMTILIVLVFLISGCKDSKQINLILNQAEKIDTSLWDQYSQNKFIELLSKLKENDYSEKSNEQLALIGLTHGEKSFAKIILEDLSMNSLIIDYDYYLAIIALEEERYNLAHEIIVRGLTRAKDLDKELFYLLRVEMLMTLGEFKKAQATIDLIMQSNPQNLHAHYLKAKLQLSNGDCENAITSLNKLIETLPEYKQFYSPLASAYRMCGKQDLAEKYAINKSDELLQFPNRLINKKQELGNPVSSLKNDIKVMINHGKINQSIQLLLQLIKLEPNDEKSYVNLGSMYYKLGNYKNAQMSYLRAHELNPLNTRALMNLGIVKMLQSDFLGAEFYFEKAYEINPDYIKLLSNLAATQIQLNKPNKAEKTLLRLLTIKYSHAKARKALIISLCMQGRYNSALAYINEWMKAEPNTPYLVQLLGNLLLQNIDIKISIIDDAQGQLLKLIQSNLDFAEIYVLLTIKYRKALELSESIRLIENLSQVKLSLPAHQRFSKRYNQLVNIGYLGLEVFE